MATEYSLAGDQLLRTRTLPQLAVRLLGSKSIESYELIREGYSKQVWRVRLDGGGHFIVKKCLNLWCAWNERTAYDYLEFLGVDHSPLIEVWGRILIFGDYGLTTLRYPTEAAIRKIGWTLRKLHDGRHRIEEDGRDAKFLLNAIVDRAQKRGYRPSRPVPTHGDVGPTNTVVLPNGDFSFFIDFEEFGRGDPLADLMVACVEFMAAHPSLARSILKWLEQSYFPVQRVDERFELWSNIAQRVALAEATLGVLEAWASQFQDHDSASLYRHNRQLLLDTFAHTST